MTFTSGHNIAEITGLALFFIGLYGLIARRNIVKSILSIGIMEVGVILFYLSVHFEPGQRPPIGDITAAPVSDPVPQALMITAIVIGVAVTAVALSMFLSLYHKYGTTNWLKAKLRRMEED